MITFFVQGKPAPWQRVSWQGKRSFVPRETAAWKTTIAWASKLHRPNETFKCPLFMMLIFSFERPKSRKDDFFCIGKSDVDNYCKSVMDALHGQFYDNDNLVVALYAFKIYGTPGVEITVGEMTEFMKNPQIVGIKNFLH